MKINSITHNYKTCTNVKNNSKKQNFCALSGKYTSSLISRNKTFLLMGLMLLGGLFACNSSENRNLKTNKIESFSVDKNIKNELTSVYVDFKSKLGQNNFLDDVTLIITDNAKNINEKSPYINLLKNDANFS